MRRLHGLHSSITVATPLFIGTKIVAIDFSSALRQLRLLLKRTLYLFHQLMNNKFNTNRLIVSKIYLTHAPIAADVTAMPNGSAGTMLC